MSVSAISDFKGDSLVLFVDDNLKPLSKFSDISFGIDFKGKYKETEVIYPNSSSLKRILLVGVGAQAKLNLYHIRSLASVGVQSLKNLGVTKNIGILLPNFKKFGAAEVAQALAEGSEISQLNFFDFKTDRKPDEKFRYEKLNPSLVVADKKDIKLAEAGFEKGLVIGEGVNWGRNLIMTPSSHKNPERLGKEAEKLAKSSKMKTKIKVSVWADKELRKHNFGGILGVGQGSTNPPRFIILEYMNGKSGEAPICLVGKGVTLIPVVCL